MHRSFRPILAALIAIAFFAAAAGAAELMVGDVRKGSVAAEARDGMTFVALDEVMTSLGLATTPAAGGLVAVFSGRKIEFWDSSAAARVNGMVTPLLAPVYQSGGHWWGEAKSSLAAFASFLASAGRPSAISIDGEAAPAAPRPAQPAPVQTKPQPVPQPIPAQTPAAPQKPQLAPYVAPTGAAAGDIALLSRVRWGEQEGAYRAVVDISEQVEVKAEHGKGEISLTFSGAMSPTIAVKAPREPFAVTSKQVSSSVVLTFKHDAQNVKGFWLTDPPRYVLDFYGGADAGQTAAVPSPAKVEIETQAPAPSAAPAQQKPPQRPSRGKRRLAIIDAGHGGHDPGALGNGLREKDINLKAALELEAILKGLGLDVMLTRRDDRYLKLAERTEIANTKNADVFISLHCNALPKGRHASGVELYLMADSTDKDALNLAVIENRELSGGAQSAAEINEAADKRTKLLLQILGDMQQNDKITESTTLAERMYEQMKSGGLSVRNVRQAPFFVLRGAGMPAILIEMGFITEKSDAKNLNSAAFRKKLLDMAGRGIQKYLASAPVND